MNSAMRDRARRSVLRKIAAMVAAGKPLGGLLAGMMATAAMTTRETNAAPRLTGVPSPGKAPVAAETNQCRQIKGGHIRGRISSVKPKEPIATAKTNEVISASSPGVQTNRVNEGAVGKSIRGEPASFVEMGKPPLAR